MTQTKPRAIRHIIEGRSIRLIPLVSVTTYSTAHPNGTVTFLDAEDASRIVDAYRVEVRVRCHSNHVARRAAVWRVVGTVAEGAFGAWYAHDLEQRYIGRTEYRSRKAAVRRVLEKVA